MADTTGGTGAPLTMDTEALAVSYTGSAENGSNTGTAEGSASLAGGFIKSKVSANTTVCCQAGQANIEFGLVTKINLSGPANVGGVVAVTMQITGSYGCCGAMNYGQIYVQSAYVDGPGLRCCGTSDPALRGDFIIGELGPNPAGDLVCNNCTYTSGSYFPITVTAYLPFDAGQTSVRYAANVLLSTAADIGSSSFIDALNTATFSIEVPPGFTYSSALAFQAPGAPSIASFSPASGPVGTSVTIAGTDLTGTTAVTFNTTSATFTEDSATQITAIVPQRATTGVIAVTTAGGTATSDTAFTVTSGPPPRITNFTPASGGEGTSVSIKGTNLADATSVAFNGTNAVFKSKGASQIAATVPPGATTGPISVTTPGGSTNTAVDFSVISSPTISGFSPVAGASGVGVTVTGTNLSGATVVKFNGAKANFTVDSETQITAWVPKSAKSGSISVTTPGGTATSNGTFTVTR